MFEKEAEEWVIDNVCKDCSRFEKCKSKEHCTCKECTKEKWQKGAEFGFNKANEWHDLRKDPNDLPKEDLRPRTLGYYLTISQCKSYKGFVFEVAYFTGVIFTKGGDILDNVIAWKEIVPPEEIEK